MADAGDPTPGQATPATAATAGTDADTLCCVCQEDLRVPAFQPGTGAATAVAVSGRDATYTMGCGHTLHVACAVQALRVNPRCPMCRAVDGVPAAAAPPQPQPLAPRLPLWPGIMGSRRHAAPSWHETPSWQEIANIISTSSAADIGTLFDLEPSSLATGGGGVRVSVEAAPPSELPRFQPLLPPPAIPQEPTLCSVVGVPVPDGAQFGLTQPVVGLDLGLVTVPPPRRPRMRTSQLTVQMTVTAAAMGAVAAMNPRACEVMYNRQGSMQAHKVTATAKFNNGDTSDTTLTWMYADGAWRRAPQNAMDGERRVVVVFAPHGGEVYVRAVSAVEDGDAMVAQLRAREAQHSGAPHVPLRAVVANEDPAPPPMLSMSPSPPPLRTLDDPAAPFHVDDHFMPASPEHDASPRSFPMPGLPALPGLPGLPALPGLPGLPALPDMPALPAHVVTEHESHMRSWLY